MKISDFGTSRELNGISTKMSFVGTVAWMAPEMIKSEPCSEKVDIWSYGIVLWELLTREIPYRDVDSSAIIWGVGNNNLHLPIPSTCPDGLALLMRQCWSLKPRNRPSFRIILNHLAIAGNELLRKSEKEYYEAQNQWREEIQAHMSTAGKDSHKMEQDLIKKRQEELRSARDIRLATQRKSEMADQRWLEVNILYERLQMREQEIDLRAKMLLKPGCVKYQRKMVALQKAQDRFYRKYQALISPRASPESRSKQEEEEEEARQEEECQPQPAQLYIELDGNNQPKSTVSQGLTQTASGNKVKKLRHRRVGSGTINSPKASPRNSRLVNVVSVETQTTADDLGIATLLDEVDAPRTMKNRSLSTSGNATTFQDACSSPDYLGTPDDHMTSSNEKLELHEGSDEDHLEVLGRQVSELSERLSRTRASGSSFKRAYVTQTKNGEVTLLRCKDLLGHRSAASEGDESWTDEDESDSNYSLRRRR